MQRLIILVFLVSCVFTSCNAQKASENGAESTKKTMTDTTNVINRTDEEWKKVLTPEQYSILRLKGTDRPFTGKYYKTSDKGVYSCAACGTELFTSDMKFDSECGWPSFDKALEGGRIKTQVDRSHGMIRTEILCSRCGGHLGHLFDDGPTATGMRYCVNSTSLNFVKAKE